MVVVRRSSLRAEGSRTRPRLDRSTVAQARAALARYPDDARLRQVVDELRARVPRFATLWDQRPLEYRHSDVKSYDVPGIGRITLDCESLAVPEDDQTLVVYSATPNTADERKLDLLRTMVPKPIRQRSAPPG